ncbi:ABC transporter substrate-binding protein [Paenibacillus allorhizosphaerae]|uniref:Extracellular solute-binding protein n=1 Tax=Paenibacillus allorhizosphaerae TaxID=2849866 RepID=A0ABM8VM29_9BACL|nr:extracellular solute-binding protein [Paenibacillus allorhizosphaerae]CAG7649235.1 hypothetical protein PAECIP111802_04439 [Paenibacillus allorhizosphaerae]
MKRRVTFGLTAAMFTAFIAGCGNNIVQQTTTGAVAEKHDPVTVRVGISASKLTEEEFARFFVDPVKKKYPWITVERELYDKGRSLSQLVAAGETPDIVWHTNIGSSLSDFIDLKLDVSLTELIKKHNLDLNRIETESLDAVKAATQREDLIAIPYTRHFSATYYSKEIFDKFGVPYPTDNMTWDQMYELAKKVTRLDSGIQYRGLEPNVSERPASQLSLPYVDPKTKKGVLQTDQWKKVMEMVTKIHRIPGNEQIANHSAADKLFVEGKLAMEPTVNILYEARFKDYPDLKWDWVTYPVWPEAPGIGMRIDAHVLALTSTSKHKDDAFLVMSALVSDEVQMDFSRQGRFSVLKDQKIRDSYGADIDYLKGKNIQALYKTKPAKSFVPTKYDTMAMTAINGAKDDIIKKGKDINTALRDAEEKLNKQIQEKEVGN